MLTCGYAPTAYSNQVFVTEHGVRKLGRGSIMQWVLVVLGLLGTTAVTVAGLYRGALAAELPKRTATGVAAVAGTVWLAWVGLSTALAAADVYRQSPDPGLPWIVVGVVVPFVVVVAASRIPVVQRILDTPGAAARLMWPQAVRVVGVVFVISWLLGDLPAVFALPAGLGDMAVGIAAVFAARRGVRSVSFNVLGLLDLVVAVSLGFLAGVSPVRLLPVEPSTLMVSVLPLVLIPTVAVPLVAALHVIALRTRVDSRMVRSTQEVKAESRR
jgi:hypothetical protein